MQGSWSLNNYKQAFKSTTNPQNYLPECLKCNSVLWKGKGVIFSLTALYPVLIEMISCRTIIKIIGYKLLSLEANDTSQDLWVFVFYHSKSNVSMSPGVLLRLFLILLGLLL